MADWKKLVVSGSTAELSGLTITNAVTASTFVGDGSNLTGISSGIFSETGSIQSTTNDLQITGSLDLSGSMTVGGDILPDTNEAYDLGSPTNRFRDLYLSGSSVFLGDTKLSRDRSGDLEIRDRQTNNLKRIRVEELEIGSGAAARRIKVNNGKFTFSDVEDSDVDAGSVGVGGIFSETGSIQSTTNDLQITGSLTVEGSIKDPTRSITTFENLYDGLVFNDGFNVMGGNVLTSDDGEAIIFDSEEQGKFPLSGSTLSAEEANIDGTVTANNFIGDGSGLTSLNVDYTQLTNIPSGILSSSVVDIDVLGNMTVNTLTETSARRYKKNIVELSETNIIDRLKPVEFEWRRDGTKDYGFIAEDVDEIDSLLTTKNDRGGLEGLKYTKLIPLLIKKVQDQDKEIQQLKELITSGSL